MKGFLSFLKAAIFLSLLSLALYFGGSITINCCDRSLDVHIASMLLILISIFYLYELIRSVFQKISSIFSGVPPHEKGIRNLQLAFSGMLLKDKALTRKSIVNAKKYLGNIPLISWIEGQLLLMDNDQHRAKALFYELCEREKNTVFGAYGLSKIAAKDHSETDCINAINAILKVYPNAIELAFQAIAISLRNNDFVEAKKHISAIKKTKKGVLVEALIYAEEGYHNNDINLVERALRLAPQLGYNAIHCADMLLKNKEYASAKKILFRAFKYTPSVEIYDKYIACAAEISDKIKIAEKIKQEYSDSWIVYFGFANLALDAGMKQIAFQNFLEAYNKAQYDFIADKLSESARLLDDPKTQAAINLLSHPLAAKKMESIWECAHCGIRANSFVVVCRNCDRIGEYTLREMILGENSLEIEKSLL